MEAAVAGYQAGPQPACTTQYLWVHATATRCWGVPMQVQYCKLLEGLTAQDLQDAANVSRAAAMPLP